MQLGLRPHSHQCKVALSAWKNSIMCYLHGKFHRVHQTTSHTSGKVHQAHLGRNAISDHGIVIRWSDLDQNITQLLMQGAVMKAVYATLPVSKGLKLIKPHGGTYMYCAQGRAIHPPLCFVP